ncbi:MAG: Cof-type HAD-IIB family hydrolase, partial [Clostridia bacterium]|nr:Cof-type HAD-IIB family hydrolase [Clostridia bacterium]
LRCMCYTVCNQNRRGAMMAELWDAYTKSGNKTDGVLVRGEPIPDGLFHMVCEVLVRHADGSVLCMERAHSKPNYPAYFEATAGGSALQGEDALTCVKRELQEETGLVCDTFCEIGQYADEGDQTIYMTYVCTVDCDKSAVRLQEGETESFLWMTETEFASFLHSDKVIARQVARFLPYYRQNGWFSYKLLALDMDGTLLGTDGKVPPRNKQAIARALQNGVHVAISTGRSFSGAKWCSEELGLTSPVIAYNGAMICDPVTSEALFSVELSPRDARMAMRLGIERGTTLCIWSKGELFGYPINERVLDYVNYAGVQPKPAADLDALCERGVTKVLWYDDASRVPDLWHEMQAIPFENVTVCPSNPKFLEFFSGDVSKAVALGKLCDLLGISRAEAVAVGDGANDIEMLSFAGLGVAMGNASDLVKRHADAVVCTNDQGGVAEVIEKWFV